MADNRDEEKEKQARLQRGNMKLRSPFGKHPKATNKSYVSTLLSNKRTFGTGARFRAPRPSLHMENSYTPADPGFPFPAPKVQHEERSSQPPHVTSEPKVPDLYTEEGDFFKGYEDDVGMTELEALPQAEDFSEDLFDEIMTNDQAVLEEAPMEEGFPELDPLPPLEALPNLDPLIQSTPFNPYDAELNSLLWPDEERVQDDLALNAPGNQGRGSP